MLNSFVLADPNRCLGCYTCMAACSVAHSRSGLQAGPRLHITYSPQGTMPVQCRHCEDAPCAYVCPVNAIEVGDGMVLVKEEACIGCKMCALACPFGAITMDGTPPPSVTERSTRLRSLLAWLAGKKAVANKCDLCYSCADEPQCIRVCPTKALRLITGEQLERLSKLKRAGSVAAVDSLFKQREE